MLSSCGTGCKLMIWSDPVKQGEGYGTVNKHQDDDDSDDPFDDDSIPDIVFAQPYPKTVWSEGIMSSPIVKNQTLQNGNVSGIEGGSSIVKKQVPVVKNVSSGLSNNASTVSQKHSPIVKSSIETPSPHVGVHPASYSRKQSSSKTKDKKDDNEEEMVQMVSSV